MAKLIRNDIRWVEDLKASCETIIKNAESIIGTEPYKKSIDITIALDYGCEPVIYVTKSISPERTVQSYTN